MFMETACSCSALHTSSSSSLLPLLRSSLPHPLPSFSFSNYPISSPKSKFKHKPNSFFLLSAIRLRKSSFIAAVAGETATIPNEPANFNDDGDGGGVNGDENNGGANQDKMTQICDKLIGVFMVDKPTPADWRKLLAFSREWDNIRPHFFRRCQERANSEDDPGTRHNLLRFARRMKEIDEDVKRHNELLGVIRNASAATEINEIVAKRRKDFTKEFFVHLFTVSQSYHDNLTEQNALAKLGNDCLASVQAFDGAAESVNAVNAAELKLQDIMKSPTLDAACRKIDDLAAKNQLDSTLVLMITKAWSAAKESNMTKDEVKDVLYHLYKTARGNLERSMPKDIRIAKYLLTIKDPEELLCKLQDAFTPGEEIEGEDLDSLYTTPEKLHTWIKSVVDAYHFSQEGTLLREARDMMNPKVIRKLEELKKLIEDKFM